MSLSPEALDIEDGRRLYVTDPHAAFFGLRNLSHQQLLEGGMELVTTLATARAVDAEDALARTKWVGALLREHMFQQREYDPVTRSIIQDIVLMLEASYLSGDDVRLYLEVNNSWPKDHLILVVFVVVQEAALAR
jgi:hypothetical protein